MKGERLDVDAILDALNGVKKHKEPEDLNKRIKKWKPHFTPEEFDLRLKRIRDRLAEKEKQEAERNEQYIQARRKKIRQNVSTLEREMSTELKRVAKETVEATREESIKSNEKLQDALVKLRKLI